MMRNTITRTLATSEITGFTLEIVDGKPQVKELEKITIAGKAKEKDALKALKKVYGDVKGLTVGNIEVSENVYEISVEDFVKYATVKKDSEPSEEVAETTEA